VCYLDLDPEKPEYTPPGQVSLVVVESLNLGPNFTHPVTPSSSLGKKANKTIRSHCVPTNLANYRDYYRSCAEDLFLAYKALQSQDLLLPLVVNTPGSLYSSDIDLLTGLLIRFKPHHTVHLSDTRAIDTDIATKLHSLQIIVSQYHGTIHEITAQSPAPLPMRTNLELKAMQMQSYFHLMKTKTSEPGIPKWTPSPTSNLLPWEFCYGETDERRQDFVGFAMYSEPVEPASLVQSLNGSIVQIVESTSSAIPTPYVALPRTNNYRVPYFEKSNHTGMVEPLDPKTSNLLCTALVRGFDPEKRVVQLLVPNTHESMLYNLSPERTVLVGGCCETPEWAYLEKWYATNGAIYAESVLDNTSCMPWVEEKARMNEMGYLNTARRVRKFQT
jgi:polynucleotide 5'-hydroxyl-kinase GRC3/NOL9